MKTITNMLFIAAALHSASAIGQVCVKQISVPEYQPILRAAHTTGTVDLAIMIGAKGKVLRVEGNGSSPILVQQAKENVKAWIFCDPKKNGSAHVQFRYDYRLEGVPVYPWPPAKVVIDLGAATVVITSPPQDPEP